MDTQYVSYNTNSFDVSHPITASHSDNKIDKNTIGQNLISTEKLNNADINNIIDNKLFDPANYYSENEIHKKSFNAYKSNLEINQNIGNNLIYKDLINDKLNNFSGESRSVTNKIVENYLKQTNLPVNKVVNKTSFTESTQQNNPENEPFWITNPSVLFSSQNFYKIFITHTMKKYTILNTLTRFCLYLFIFNIFFAKTITFLLLPIICIIVIVILYLIQKSDTKDLMKEKLCTNNKCSEQLLCQKPTISNPYMNLTMGDMILNREKEENCQLDNSTQHSINQLFNKDAYRDIDDFYNKSIAQRQFYTTPCTKVANDQKRFANWLYRIPETCKENGVNCLKYEDIRFNRYNPIVDEYQK